MNVLRPSMTKSTLAYINEHKLEMPSDKQECIKKALEKQIPKLFSALKYGNETKMFCPSCSGTISIKDDYCSHCGQRIKREDGNKYGE